jgi:FecR protein
MKKCLASLAALSLLTLGLMPALALGQAPPPPSGSSTEQDDPYAPADNGTSTQAQPQEEAGPGVARVSFIKGDVSSQRGDNGDWVAVTQNSPISQGDRVATGQNSRAELQLDFANVLRMSANATANVKNLSRTDISVQIGQGLVTYTVRNGGEANPEIDTPNASIHPSGPGQYRILVNSDSETQVIIRQGSADISTSQGSTHVDQGQMITVQGTDDPQYKTEAAMGKDDWDTWINDRDHRINNASSWGKTDRYYTGSEDLDTYGTWSEVPDYGPVWTPAQTSPDWAPYRDGRWVYEPYYGWTWVSYEPWGWAPYHYGRWFVYGGRWAWWPGPVVGYPGYYPIWSPAYVSFFGFGGGGFGFGVGFGFGFGRFGWLPCGPGDWYHPWFGRYGGRYNTVNIRNYNNFHEGFRPLGGNRGRQFSNINQAASNARVRGGVSSMAGNEFGRGAVSRHQAGISEESFRQGSVMTGKMPVTPSRESFSPSGRAASASAIRSASPSSQHFFSGGSRANSNAGSRSFGNSNAGAGSQSGFGGNRSNGSVNTQSPRSFGNSGAATESSRQGWQHFTPPQSGASNRSGQGFGGNSRGEVNNTSRGSFSSPSRESTQGSQAGNRGSWQHFTPPTQASRGGSSNSYNSYSRPPLNMRQPIVTPRGGSRGNGSNPSAINPYGSSAPHGSYNAPRGGYSTPNGSYNAPRGGYSAPRATYSAPRGNNSGGGSHGGGSGGTHSGGGGGHSGGGHSSGGHH